MALLPNSTDAPDVGARTLLRAHAAMPSLTLIEKVARCYVAVTIIVYVVDLLQQTRDGLTDGAGRPFGDDFVNFWSGPFLA